MQQHPLNFELESPGHHWMWDCADGIGHRHLYLRSTQDRGLLAAGDLRVAFRDVQAHRVGPVLLSGREAQYDVVEAFRHQGRALIHNAVFLAIFPILLITASSAQPSPVPRTSTEHHAAATRCWSFVLILFAGLVLWRTAIVKVELAGLSVYRRAAVSRVYLIRTGWRHPHHVRSPAPSELVHTLWRRFR